ncbi:nuclear GTP-binding protein [Sporothrix brasiliensis 5110]|uniref:Nucleolar GTP-binding protein 2 n=1 Tax=Sporothrix brasiliensis 5110 TaxID=1398154 RepID=A0A0C2IS61_9PEZI|nr:nuclear GTP-binding protein [Sporothrix brasiliensis 5110]KIH91871.1 nuclear GTP-binding protein [Sporothrix brasiliensis 5110]
MGTGKKEASRRSREGKQKDGNIKVKGENFYRSAKKVKQLNMYKEGKAQRDSEGNITKAASYQSRDIPTAVIEPNRRWFQNSRVISQESLTAFRSAMAEQAKDPNRFLLKSAKLPMSLIRDETSATKQKPVLADSFADVFGDKATRKRVTMKDFSTLDDLADTARLSMRSFNDRRSALVQNGLLSAAAAASEGVESAVVDKALEELDYVPPEVGHEEADASSSLRMEPVFSKGQSRRIWNELYRTIDSSDVIIHVLDARDPIGTTCRTIQDYIKNDAPHKHLIYILNKCDLVPSGVAARWVKTLQKTVPTCAFRASITNPFGKGSLISLLRQFSSLHADRKQISVGLVGYPNVGKSSVLNALLGKKACTVAPVPGETKVWQFVRLMKRIYLIDCPGIVPPDSNASPEDILLRGAVRTEKVYNPAQYISAVLKKTKKHHLARTYELNDWTDATDFLDQLSRKRGRLLAGGDADADGMARIVLNDFLRGKIPWFTPPPELSPEDQKAASQKGRVRDEAAKKRKRDDADGEAAPSTTKLAEEETVTADGDAEAEKAEDAEEFGGFGTDSAPSDFGSDDEDDLISLGSISDDESDYGDAPETAGASEDEEDKEDDDDEEAEEADGGVTHSSDEEEAPPEPQQKPKAKRQKR